MASTTPSGSKRKEESIRSSSPASLSKKKKCSYSSDKCLFCQGNTSGELRISSDDGRSKAVQCAIERRNLNDKASDSIIERVLTVISKNSDCSDIKWHHACYSNFTHQGKIARLNKKQGLNLQKQRATRSNKQHGIDWSLCMFCQKTGGKAIRNVATMELSTKIINLSELDSIMYVRLANISDLVASEGKYHLSCWVQFQRKVNKIKEFACMDNGKQKSHHCFYRLCSDLIGGLESGHIYDMGNVWVFYEEMCERDGINVPKRYVTRRASFYDDIKKILGSKASFVRPIDPTGHLLLYPSHSSNIVIAVHLSNIVHDKTDEADVVVSPVQNSQLQNLVHTALHIRRELEQMPGHNGGWGGINEDHVNRIIPDSLSLFLQILLGGTNVLEELPCKNNIHKSANNIAQDIIYAVSKGSKLTPKHVGLGLTLHQATRSEKLVGLFHAAGHTIGIDTIRRFDTSIATDILNRYEENDNVYIPYEIAPYTTGRVVLASCDNIDVLEETIDGKNTFHCTQMMLWQRGPVRERPVTGGAIGRARTVTPGCLEQFHKLDRAYMPVGERPNPVFDEHTDFDCDEWFATNEEKNESDLKNLTWILTRMLADEKIIPGWAAFNEATCVIDPPLTTPGMLPILQAPADENNTVTTVINHFMSISEKLGQPFTIITADQPLYSRGKELIWANYEKYGNVVLIMGHLHILFNFLKAIGQHMENAGLVDVWVESGLFACNSTNQMMEGKSYYRAVRGHTLAYEALNRIYWNYFVKWVGTQEHLKTPELRIKIGEIVQEFSKGDIDSKVEKVSSLVELLNDTAILELMKEYDNNQQDTPNFVLWRTYMKMVETLLNFIRANREGNWNLHLQSFADMLPWMTVYDHTNYARWGTIYLAEMKNLEISQPIIHREFMNGNFVVRRGKGRFNQVPIDQATEWQNRVCKISNGIIGITRNDTARDKFCITWAERSYISHSTRCLLEIENEDEDQLISTRKDAQPSRIRLDEDSVTKLEEVFKRFNVFGLEGEQLDGDIMEEEENESTERSETKQLVSLATNDVSTAEIENDLLSAQTRGVSMVQSNVSKWFIEKETPFFDPLPKVKSKTFASLYKTTFAGKQNEKKMIKADRRLLQQLLTASLAGRKVDLNEVLQHELSSIPLSLAKVNGDMNSTTKAELAKIITKNEKILPNVTEPGTTQRTCILVDGHAYIQSLGKPKNCKTFEEYARIFFKSLLINVGENVDRIDVVFDRYISMSIKSTTRTKRGTNKRPIRRIISRGDLPLPQT